VAEQKTQVLTASRKETRAAIQRQMAMVVAVVARVLSVQMEAAILAAMVVLVQMFLLSLLVAHYLRLLVVAVQVKRLAALVVRQSVVLVRLVRLTQQQRQPTRRQAVAVLETVAWVAQAVAVLSM
jgi:hypothetical protein